MESCSTRRTLRSFPIDLAFTQDPTDDLRQYLDSPGRQLTVASEYVRTQLDNLLIGTANLNEPSQLYASGISYNLDAVMSGNFVEDMQDLASMSVTGFDLDEILYPSGISTDLRGISFVQSPDVSGILYLSADADQTIFAYNWNLLDVITTTHEYGVTTQSYDVTGEDEYLVIDKSEYGVTKAVLKHVPLSGVTIIDSKNLQSPWDPANSDGIYVPQTDIFLSGNTVFLTNPRPSYVPAIIDSTGTTYPVGYQPDEEWNSSFITEYDYLTYEPPYGLTQPDIRHEMGLPGRPIGGSDEIN